MPHTTPPSGTPGVSARPPRSLCRLAEALGIRFNGDRPWDIQVHDASVYRRILVDGSLGLGEAYMDGHWDSEALDELFHRIMSVDIKTMLEGWTRLEVLTELMRHRLLNLQSRTRAYQVGEQHYDTGNDVFEAMLDSSMSYSCAYWKDAEDLEQAQVNKLDIVCRKLELQPGERLLDIGCGWGGLAQHAARHHGVEVLGITVSREQELLARQRCAGLPVEIALMDYRELRGEFDKVVSVGMFEHVGPKNYHTYFRTVDRLLKDDGLFLLHTIGIYKTTPTGDAWLDKYIFPNSKLPSPTEIAKTVEGRFLIEDWHNFGQDYDRTLMAWWKRFDAAWPQLADKYGERFYRMWKYYLHSCAGFFRSRQGQLWQLVLSKPSRRQTYRSLR